MTSNQSSDSVIGALKATVSYTYGGSTVTKDNLASGTSVKVPTGVTPTITFPDATGYRKTVSGSAAQYDTEILTVTITKDAGDGNMSTPTITVKNGQTTLGTLHNGDSLKIPYGVNYTCEASELEGYSAPASVTKNWADTTAKALTFTYEEQAGFVDLGLPSGLKWAQGNIVKNGNKYEIGEETDYGAYFSWGNITPHFSANGSTFDDSYDFGTSNSGPYASTPGKSVSANIPSNDATHDAALALLGSPWHLPTKENFQELYDNTDREWTTINGVSGWKFMKKTDHSLYVFFPAAGYGYGTSLYYRGSDGYYWSSSWYSADSAYNLSFSSSSVNPQSSNYRYLGFSVRAVQ
jgi:uncharacterized protein (TIGR02145 family)